MAEFTGSKAIVLACLTGILYFIGAWVGVTQTITPDGIAIIWPPNAVLLTALLITPRREWWLIAVAVIVAECVADVPAFPLWAAVGFAFTNLFEAVLAAFLIRRFAGEGFSFQTVRQLSVFLVSAPLVASAFAAIIGAGIYVALGRTDNSFFALWRLWWFGDALGLLLLTPLLLSVWHSLKGNWRIDRARSGELALVWGGLVFTCLYAFNSTSLGDLQFHLTPIIVLPFAIWIATRFATLATAGTIAIIAGMAIVYLVRGAHPYAQASPQYAVWLTQEYLAVLSTVSIGLSVLTQELRRQRNSLLLQERAMLASNDAISIADMTSRDMPLSWVNPRFEELFGYRKEEVLGRNCRFLQGGHRDEAALETVRWALRERTACRVQLQNYTKSGQPIWIELSLAPVHDVTGQVTHYIGIQHDLTDQRETEQRLREATNALQQQNVQLEEKVEQRTRSVEASNAALCAANQRLQTMAYTDVLTGIANRRHFYDLGERELHRLKLDGRTAVLISLDLDHFKSINDSYGHEAGDEVLRQIVKPVLENMRPGDLFGRVGGEEFLILLADVSESEAKSIAGRIRAQIAATPIDYGGLVLHVTASFGIAKWDQDCSLDALVRRADLALYAAKHAGRNRVQT
ncbi:hypothetical protein RE428_41320 [Marinobacter nanhaiticus D15-8W]|uniref:Sensor domain-containing diguanylate cyclase n=1 Tax=Marinobacter nanhaiticus D15-8W TaxID=626887 RepID=N6WWN8_9GAMM|nr:sensor domain-containing diguanylate cyclase [Marinobacter nanhaiticus]ENO16026.1 sensor domain-containing diguanylate cyclase [Marinobacter nanhaiticus D15-8W]BES73114.1 hypothetical protein RE428_41320 [Marinobacter nanhaiticus D15-8W]